MSESKCRHVQARVRAAMDAQVVNEGRHEGGRAPYGYVVANGGPHPNPRKAVEGARLRVLRIDPATAPIVRRIFAEYLAGSGDRTIAAGLNRDGVLCPSACRPRQNPHRRADGWQGSTVRSILENPRYMGTRSSAAGHGMNCCSTPTTPQQARSSDSAAPIPARSSGHAHRPTRLSSRSRTSRASSCSAARNGVSTGRGMTVVLDGRPL